jgi:integrase/recombinase XerD
MFDQLFERSKALARQRNGPLLNERLAYLTHMAGLGTARNTLRTIARYLLTVAEVLHLARRPGERITRTEIREQAARWANRVKPQQSTPPSPTARPLFIRFATAWLRFLDRLLPVTPPAGPYDRWVQAFADDLRQERGLNAKTVSSHSRYVLDFLGRIGVSPEAWPRVTLAEIEDALREKLAVAGYARNTASHYGEALRAFFRFAQRHGWCRSGLAEGILLPRIYQQERIPSGPSWDVVQRLIQKIQGDRPNDLRDRAVLMVLAVYGLRAGEVVRLRLEDIDWPNDLLIVARPKSGRSQTFPLCRSVGAAILRYLREARPRSPHRPIFLHGRAPYAPLRSCGVTSIVSRRFADLGVPLTRCGSHALRHACATHLLEQGLSLKEIGDHLGHRHPETTRIYTKVDVPQLRRVADIDLGELL